MFRYLVGNPCTEIEGYRHFVIASLPQLQTLDGKDIEKSEKIIAMQEYGSIRERLIAKSMESLSCSPTQKQDDDKKELESSVSNQDM